MNTALPLEGSKAGAGTVREPCATRPDEETKSSFDGFMRSIAVRELDEIEARALFARYRIPFFW